MDIGAALLFLLVFPFTFFRIKHPGKFFANCLKVLAGSATWVGYASGQTNNLPSLKKGIIQPYNILIGYEPNAEVRDRINTTYAQHYAPATDISLLLKNYRYLGGVS